MTMKPKTSQQHGETGETHPRRGPRATEDGFGRKPFPNSRAAEMESEGEDIGNWDLTPNQLRAVMILAKRHGVEAVSPIAAIQSLLEKGIDPVQRAKALAGLIVSDSSAAVEERENAQNLGAEIRQKSFGVCDMTLSHNEETRSPIPLPADLRGSNTIPATLETDALGTLVSGTSDAVPFASEPANTASGPAPQAHDSAAVAKADAGAPEAANARNAPVVVPAPPTSPGTGNQISTEVADPATRRAREVQALQRDIARRRRVRMALLAARLFVFVLLPTLAAAYYFFSVATPMYATESDFVIQQADGQGTAPMGGLLAATGMASSQDSITVQRYLSSREAMLRLDADLGFRDHFSQPEIDPLRKLAPDATNEEAYRLYKKQVKIGYDPTEGIVRMEVSAADPELSAAFSRALIGYAEEQVDQLTQRLREDQMQGARAVYAEAEANMTAAQERVLALQEQLGVFDAETESAGVMDQIGTFETELNKKRLQLEQLLDNAQPNAARVSGVEGDIARLESLIAGLRGQLTQSTDGAGSLAQVSGQLRMAEVDLETRTAMMQEALKSLEAARTEANRQVRYLSLGVNPIPPDEPTSPRALQSSLLAGLIFAGIYLMVSLTLSILREQITG